MVYFWIAVFMLAITSLGSEDFTIAEPDTTMLAPA